MNETIEDLHVIANNSLTALLNGTKLTDRKLYRLNVLGQNWQVEFHKEYGSLGWTSICVLRHDGPYIAFAGVAICAPSDPVDWQIGFKLAFKRAVEQAAVMYGTNIPLNILDAAFRYGLWSARMELA